MKILIADTNAVSLQFQPAEMRVAINLLKIILSQVNVAYIREAIEELESRLRPKLTLVSHFHLCESCFRMVDDHEENAIHLTGEVDKWKHRNCPPLKPNRPE